MPSGMMDLLSTPTTFPLELDWEGKMEPSSPSAQSQQSYAEDPSNFEDDFYDFCNEPLFNNSTLIDFDVDVDVDLKPDPLALLKAQDLVLPIVVGKQEKAEPRTQATPERVRTKLSFRVPAAGAIFSRIQTAV
uniref:Uncharacterized protein n=1 Tax=Anopheles atroparvus TaxID=41427 RepID=A0A182J919_ANOAO